MYAIKKFFETFFSALLLELPKEKVQLMMAVVKG